MQKIDIIIFVVVAILMLIGAVFSYSLPLFLEHLKGWNEYHFFSRYIVYAFFGFIFMIVLANLNPDKWFNIIGFSILIISGIMVIAIPFLPSSVAPVIKGAKRWIQIGSIHFAPVEFFKIGVIFFLSWSFTRKIGKAKNLKEELKTLLPYLFVLGIFWAIISMLLSDLGQVMVMLGIFITLLFAAGGKFKTFALILLLGAIGGFYAVLSKPYRLERIKTWYNTALANYIPHYKTNASIIQAGQVSESLNAIHHGGIFGTGIGNGVFKLGYLSDVHTDFVLAGIAEEAGLVGITIILGLFAVLLYRIFKIANRSEKQEYKLFALGVGALIALQLLINGFGITSILPLKGLTVPFLSYGGSSLLAFSVAIGMVLMISKKAKM
ncbi:FtsW/RodA/SpoVE family cell cycle protein [Caminibacter sp.]